MNLNYFTIRSAVMKRLANVVLGVVFVVVGLGLSSTSVLAVPQSQAMVFHNNVSLASVSRQSMADTQSRGLGKAKTKAELDQELQSGVQEFQSGVKGAVESAAGTAASAVQDLANPETEKSAQQLGNRARRDMQILKDTAEDLGPN